ncbi:MAG: hypothetical protein ACKVPJ_13505 [Chitinophagales bacterium]
MEVTPAELFFTNLNEIKEFIQSKFLPAESLAESELEVTTEQIEIEIKAHFGEVKFNTNEIVLALKEAGFKYDVCPGGLKFIWLLKYKI